ncbi:MAG: hypothetical protein KF901_06155 [Myxococcales bacterium]|nr:hypothetical protein [Myxococcales bacterium]
MCNGLDDDCDGHVDEGCACTPGAVDDRCGASVGVCTLGTRTCELVGGEATWSTCTGIAPSAETCNHLDDDCDGRIDEGRGRPNCSRHYHSSTAGLHACAPTACCTYSTSPPAPCTPRGGAITRLINALDRDASRGIFANLGANPLDWGRADFTVEARAEIVVPCTTSSTHGTTCKGAPPARSWSVVIAPTREVSQSPDDHGLSATTGGRRGYAATLSFESPDTATRPPTLKIFQLGPSGPLEVASVRLACGPTALFPVRLGLTSSAVGANGVRLTATASVDGVWPDGSRGEGCPSEVSVSYDDVEWRTMLYGERSDFPRYQVGTVARVEGANCTELFTPPYERCTTIDLLEMTLSRGGRAQEGHCVGCPD